MLRRPAAFMFAVLVVLLSACAGRSGTTAPGHGPSYSLRVELAIAGQLASDRGRGEIRADLTGELTVDAAGAGTQVHSRIVAVRDVHVDPALTRPDPRALRTVLLATDDYWTLGARPTSGLSLAPQTVRPSAIAFFHDVFTRDLGLPSWLPTRMPAEGSSLRTTRRGLHGGIESNIDDTLTLVRIDPTMGASFAEYVHTSIIRSVPSFAIRGAALEVHEHATLRVDLATGRPLQHTRRRTELLIHDGEQVVHNTVTIDATYTTIARPERG